MAGFLTPFGEHELVHVGLEEGLLDLANKQMVLDCVVVMGAVCLCLLGLWVLKVHSRIIAPGCEQSTAQNWS